MPDTSRDLGLLHPLLREAWEYLRDDYKQKWPESPVPRISTTYRGPIAQERAKAAGASRFGYGESLHNFKPAYAFDIYFDAGGGRADWNWVHFERFSQEAKRIGLEWGGDWPGLLDGPHFQFRGAKAEHARRGHIPHRPNVPRHDGWKLVLMLDGKVIQTVDMRDEGSVNTRVAQDRARYYVDVRSNDHA